MYQEPFAATSTIDWYTEARRLMAAPKEGWEPADYAHAAAVLIHPDLEKDQATLDRVRAVQRGEATSTWPEP